jgi:hypothetical protein
MRSVTKRKRKRDGDASSSFLETYRRIRKPMPPPGQILADKRRRMRDEDGRREIDEEAGRRDGPRDG